MEQVSSKDCSSAVLLRSVVDSPCGFRYLIDTLEICSGYARRRFLDAQMICNPKEISAAYGLLHEAIAIFYESEAGKGCKDLIKSKFCDLKEIKGTLGRLASGAVLDDIELFEIKALIILSGEIREVLKSAGFSGLKLPLLQQELSLLDPDGLGIRSFYVYDSYSEELRKLRAEIKRSSDEQRQVLELKEKEIERGVRQGLCAHLMPSSGRMMEAMETLADLDILLAKAEQMLQMKLTFPKISENGETSYRGLFHPQVKSLRKSEFVPIDIEFGSKPVIITGANMGGKTVSLMMCALSQYLFQFGMGIPAEEAVIAPVEEVYVTIGDGQSLQGGFSSFAAEMLSVNRIIAAAREGRRLLALIDEPARTTNPIEGRALVQGMLEVLSSFPISVIISTHYNVESGDFRWLRVAGFVNGKMDYRLVEALKGEVPHEAVRIAQDLGVDAEWLETSGRYLEN